MAAPFAGGLLAVFIDRWPRGEPVLSPLGWAGVWGKGRRLEPLVITLSVIILSGWAVWSGTGWKGPAGALLAWGLLALGWIDAKHFYLPDALTLPLLGLGLLFVLAFIPERFGMHLAGAVVAYAAFRLINWVYLRRRGREGLGAGDAKLLAASGAWLGLDALPEVVLIGALSALLITLAVRLARSVPLMRDEKIPFGAYLAAATWFSWTYGPLMKF